MFKSVSITTFDNTISSLSSIKILDICSNSECANIADNSIQLEVANVRNTLSNISLPEYEEG